VLDQAPFVVWFTGLPGAGKSTLAQLVGLELEQSGVATELLDGDRFRRDTSPLLGYTRSDRARNVEQLAHAASELVRSGTSVLVASIAPYEEQRNRAREIVEMHAPFVEVHVDASIETCISRDPKGHYRKALTGELEHFTGVSDPYEVPARPELTVDTNAVEPAASAALVFAALARGSLATRLEV
jgi:adenylyl-sulfate kinase